MVTEADELRMPLMDHLRELRSRIIVCMWTLGITITACFFFANDLFGILAAPMNEALKTTGRGTLAMTVATEAVVVQMKVSGLAGLFLSSPILFWQAWKFVGPGLYPNERKRVLPLVASSTFLFLSGAAFAYFGVFRYGFPFFLEMSGPDVTAVLSIDSYLGLATTLLVAFGASFQLPVVAYFLARVGLIHHIDMLKGFRYAIVGIFIAAAVLTPPDVISQMIMAVPLLFLYGVSIGVVRLATTKPIEIPEDAAHVS